jgi:hypothetical protein
MAIATAAPDSVRAMCRIERFSTGTPVPFVPRQSAG